MKTTFNDKLDFIIHDADLLEEFQHYLKHEDLELSQRGVIRVNAINQTQRDFIRNLMMKGMNSQADIIATCQAKGFDNATKVRKDIYYLQSVLEIDIVKTQDKNYDEDRNRLQAVIKQISKMIIAGKSNSQIVASMSRKYPHYTRGTIRNYIKRAKQQLATYGIETRLDVLWSLERTKIVFLVQHGYKMSQIAKLVGIKYQRVKDRYYASQISKEVIAKRKMHLSILKTKAYEYYKRGFSVDETQKLLNAYGSTVRRLYDTFEGSAVKNNKRTDGSIRKRALALYNKGFSAKETIDILCAYHNTIYAYYAEFQKQ